MVDDSNSEEDGIVLDWGDSKSSETSSGQVHITRCDEKPRLTLLPPLESPHQPSAECRKWGGLESEEKTNGNNSDNNSNHGGEESSSVSSSSLQQAEPQVRGKPPTPDIACVLSLLAVISDTGRSRDPLGDHTAST